MTGLRLERLRGGPARLALLAAVGLLAFVSIAGTASPHATPVAGASSASTGSFQAYTTAPTVQTPGATAPASALTLGITTSPHSICAFDLSTCAAGTGTARVTLTASAGSSAAIAWPSVQVAFVVETTQYDGVYDPLAGDPGRDPCAAPPGSTHTVCEESNGVPFFVANAQLIANAISEANPHSSVSFAMVDYFATLTNWDDNDGAEYHVDLPQFVPASTFGEAVTSTFQSEVLGGNMYYGDSDLSDNELHSSSITALYGTIIGSGLDWSNDTHHVIVWIGATAPRDPSYAENMCVDAQDQTNVFLDGCIGSTCEPSYTFAVGSSPGCEGWVQSRDGNPAHSIAALAHQAPSCTGSIGHVCTVDTIDLYTTPTDPLSPGWPAGVQGGGPNGPIVQEDVTHILLAGCDMAAATGGSWDGPAFASCPNGQAGTLQYVAHGSYDAPNTQNPTLFNALRQIGFGPVLDTQVAAGGNRPIFAFVPFGNIAPAPNLQATAACVRAGTDLKTCQQTPTILHYDGLTYLGWNWSVNATQNVMYIGDLWTASFNVIATGPPYATVPVDACVTIDCKAGGSGSIDGLYTWATYVPYTNNTVLTQSFPLGQVSVEITPPTAPPPTVPPAPPAVPPGLPVAAPLPTPVLQQLGIGQNIGIGNVSLQAAAAGFLGAGFMRVSIKNRPIAMRMAAKSGTVTSKFDKVTGETGIGRFE